MDLRFYIEVGPIQIFQSPTAPLIGEAPGRLHNEMRMDAQHKMCAGDQPSKIGYSNVSL